MRRLAVGAIGAAVLAAPASALGASADLSYVAASTAAQAAEEGPTFTHSATVTNGGPDSVTATIRFTTNPGPLSGALVQPGGGTPPVGVGSIVNDPNGHSLEVRDFTLPSGGTLTVSTTLSPDHPWIQTTTGTVVASSAPDPNAANNSASAATMISGLTVSGAAFGDQLLGSASGPRPVTVTNGSAQSVQLSAPPAQINGPERGGANPGDFAFTDLGPCSGATLAPGAGCSVSTRFVPLALGDRSAAVTFWPVSGPVDPATGILSGRGTASRDVTAPLVTITGMPKSILLKKLRRSGIRFRESANEPAAFSNDLLGRPRTATLRRALAKAYSLTLAHSALPLAGGTRTVRLKPSRRLIGKAKRFGLRVVVVATDASGNRRTTTKTIKVR